MDDYCWCIQDLSARATTRRRNSPEDTRLAAVKPVGRRPFTAAISKDEGATWQHIQNIGTDPQGWYCYTAIEFVDDHILLAHCEFPGLNSLQITRVPVSWLYKTNEDPQQR